MQRIEEEVEKFAAILTEHVADLSDTSKTVILKQFVSQLHKFALEVINDGNLRNQVRYFREKT